MDTSTDMGFALAKTFGMLAVVIALLILLLYAIRYFSSGRVGKNRQAVINVLATHHFSPKEKVVLLEVMDRCILVGITPQSITQIANFDHGADSGSTSPPLPGDFDAALKHSVDGMSDQDGVITPLAGEGNDS